MAVLGQYILTRMPKPVTGMNFSMSSLSQEHQNYTAVERPRDVKKKFTNLNRLRHTVDKSRIESTNARGVHCKVLK
jgi:hypothetical protein